MEFGDFYREHGGDSCTEPTFDTWDEEDGEGEFPFQQTFVLTRPQIPERGRNHD